MGDYRYKSVIEPVAPNQLPYTTRHQSSTLTYFTQQAIRVSAGYSAPRVGNILDQHETMRRDIEKVVPQFGKPLDHLHHQPTNMHENIRRDIETVAPQSVNTYDHLQHQPTNMREVIWREMEKERIREEIREEIIAEENARRHVLEFEVRREIMMERQLAKQNEGFSAFSSPGMALSSMLPFVKQRSDPRYGEERIARSIEERMGRGISVSGLGGRNEIGRLDMVPFKEQISEIPFQQRSVDPKTSELKPVSLIAEPIISERQPLFGPNKEKDRIILLAKSNSSLSGAKRKAVTTPAEAANKHPSFDVPKKNGKEDWSCALCQVSATSERGLNDHLRGKKHKSKEAALKAQRNGKNYSIGLFPKKPKSTNLIETIDNLNMEEMVKPKVELLPHKISGVGSSLVNLEKEGARDNTSSLPVDQKNVNAAQKKQKSKENKRKKYKFWCETCKIGALSEKSMEAHRIGKKHMNRLQELNGCSITASTTKAESTQTVDEALENAKLRDPEVVATSTTKVESTQIVNEALDNAKL